MPLRIWTTVGAGCLLALQSGCQLQQAGPIAMYRQVAEVQSPKRPILPEIPNMPATARALHRPYHDEEEPSYALVAIDPDATPSAPRMRPVSPEDALRNSSLMHELPAGSLQLTNAPLLTIDTPSTETRVAKPGSPEVVSGAHAAVNSARAETIALPPANMPTQPVKTAPEVIVTQATRPSEPSNVVQPLPTKQEPPRVVQAPAPVTSAKTISSSSLDRSLSGRTLLNSPNVALNYRVHKVGPSGVSKVEVWVTNDQGTTWQRLCEDLDRRTPSEIQLPGEGTWGIRLVAVNGNGFGGTAPRRGEQPNFSVDIDTTNPRVVLGSIEQAEGQVLDIRWNAQDLNLGSAPVTIQYRTQTNQPWQLVAANVPNTGHHRWQFPPEQPQFYIRVHVADEAGNTTVTESPNAVAVDVTVPQLAVVGVSTANKR